MYIADKLFVAGLICCLVSIVAFIIGGATRNRVVLMFARLCVFATLGLVTAVTAHMIQLLLHHDFSFEYVAEYTIRDLSTIRLISALWAGNQGTLLFWAWLVAVTGALLVMTGRGRDREIMPLATSVVMIIEALLLALLLYVMHPFVRMAVTPLEGLGLTPFFNSAGMLVHPPLLLAGFAGFCVPFALALAVLITGRLDNDWLILARRWGLISWLLLGAGIITGAWWSYTGLGAGSYWHWEPIENASLMPWLTSTAWLHSIAIQRKRGGFKVWGMILIIMTFAFIVFSIFLNRSVVILSVITSSKSVLGRSFFGFLAATMLVSLTMLFLRRRRLESRRQIESVISKEGTFLLTNLLLVVSSLAILLGTILTLLNHNVQGMQASLAVPFLNRVNIPIFLALILLAGICVSTGWRKVTLGSLCRNLCWPFAASVTLGLVLFLFGMKEWYALAGLAMCCFVPYTVVAEWIKSTAARRRSRGENPIKAFLGLVWNDKPRHGGYIIHIGIVFIAVGILCSSAFSVSNKATLKPGEAMSIGNYSLVFEKLNYDSVLGQLIFSADISIYRNDKLVGKLAPIKYFDQSFNGEVNTAAIRSNPVEDLYVTIVGWDKSGVSEFKASVYPLTMWIWIGGWLMLLGGLIAFWPEKQRDENTGIEN